VSNNEYSSRVNLLYDLSLRNNNSGNLTNARAEVNGVTKSRPLMRAGV
jgi:hypothetical protein